MSEDFESNLPGTVQVVRVIHLAMAFGVASFAAVVLYMYFTTTRVPEPSAERLIRILSSMNAALFAGLWAASPILYRSALAKAEGDLLKRFQAAETLRLALREGSAFMGLVVCLMAAMDGVLAAKPVFWANALPAFAFWFFVQQNYAVEDRLRALRAADPRAGSRLVASA